MLRGHKFTAQQKSRLSVAHLGQKAWNKGTGGCKKGHSLELYVAMPSGVKVCLGCKRENGSKYRQANRSTINLRNRVKRYNISVEEYEQLLCSQNQRCAICGNELSKHNVRVDHSHKTGRLRGLLCVSCNTGIGLLKDSPDILRAASAYLRSG